VIYQNLSACCLVHGACCLVPVFVTCADDIILFDSNACSFTTPGFTALAHRSALVTAAGHGVFLLQDGSDNACEARAFLHKPSEDRMRATGDVHVTQHPGGENEWAHTDSAFFFDYSVAVKLVEFWDDVLGGKVSCEIDCYGDF
jgi:hypothetical protein